MRGHDNVLFGAEIISLLRVLAVTQLEYLIDPTNPFTYSGFLTTPRRLRETNAQCIKIFPGLPCCVIPKFYERSVHLFVVLVPTIHAMGKVSQWYRAYRTMGDQHAGVEQ